MSFFNNPYAPQATPPIIPSGSPYGTTPDYTGTLGGQSFPPPMQPQTGSSNIPMAVNPNLPPLQMPDAGLKSFVPGPFCFGLDRFICQNIPTTLHLSTVKPVGTMEKMLEGAVPFDVNLQSVCQGIANTICAVTVALVLLLLLTVGIAGLFGQNPKEAAGSLGGLIYA